MRIEGMKRAEPGFGERLRLALLSWPFLLALAVLLLNDHYLKASSPGFISGKLSDVAGIFGVGLVCFAARANRPWLIAAILFASFLWWKSPASQPFIDAVISLGYTRIGRTVDYTDLGCFAVLPLAWCAACRLEDLGLGGAIFRRLATVPVLVTSALAVAATSEPRPQTFEDQWVFRPTSTSQALRRPEVSAAVEAAVERHGMKARDWKPDADRVRYTRDLITMVYEFGPNGALSFTVTGREDIGFFFTDDVVKIMSELKHDVRREFRWRFGDLAYNEASPSPRLVRPPGSMSAPQSPSQR